MKTITQTENIKHANKRFVVNVAFNGGVNYEVFAQDKDSASELAMDQFDDDFEIDSLYGNICETETEAIEHKPKDEE